LLGRKQVLAPSYGDPHNAGAVELGYVFQQLQTRFDTKVSDEVNDPLHPQAGGAGRFVEAVDEASKLYALPQVFFDGNGDFGVDDILGPESVEHTGDEAVEVVVVPDEVTGEAKGGQELVEGLGPEQAGHISLRPGQRAEEGGDVVVLPEPGHEPLGGAPGDGIAGVLVEQGGKYGERHGSAEV
jgi:hypothetical protein